MYLTGELSIIYGQDDLYFPEVRCAQEQVYKAPSKNVAITKQYDLLGECIYNEVSFKSFYCKL